MLQTVKRRIKRFLKDFKPVAGDLPDTQQHPIAMKRTQRDSFQDEEIQRALNEINRLRHASLFWMVLDHSSQRLLDCQGEAGRPEAVRSYLKIDFAIMPCTPFLPSTS